MMSLAIRSSRMRSSAVNFNSGKLVIVAILATALLAAVFAWWKQYDQGRRALEYWGVEGARLIRTAPQVELQSLRRDQGDAAEKRPIAQRLDVSGARGLVHARQALISDPSFLWDEKPAAPPKWEYALVFHNGPQEITVLLDLAGGWVASESGRSPIRLGPTLASGLKQFFQEQFVAA